MQRCPKCNRTYSNDSQKFCTHDGGRLEWMDDAAMQAFDPNATIRADASDLISSPDAATSDLNATIAFPPATPTTAEIRGSDTAPTTRHRALEATQAAVPAAPPPQQQQPTSAPLPQPPPAFSSPPQPSGQLPPTSSLPPASPQLPGPSYATSTAPAAHRPAQKSKLPLILGAVALLFLMFVGASAVAYFAFIRPRLSPPPVDDSSVNVNTAPAVNPDASANINGNENSAAAINENAEGGEKGEEEAPPFEPPPNSAKFENSPGQLSGKLAEHYVDFSFYYPESWEIEPAGAAAGASNFVKVERKLPPDFPQERLTVSWYESGGTVETDSAIFRKLVELYSSKFQTLPGYRKVSEGETAINSLDGYEFRFEGLSKGTEKGDVSYWGRVVFLPPGVEGEKNGVTLLMLTSSLAPELQGVDDVGVKGELPLVLESFRFDSK